jgi:hypothetical protein
VWIFKDLPAEPDVSDFALAVPLAFAQAVATMEMLAPQTLAHQDKEEMDAFTLLWFVTTTTNAQTTAVLPQLVANIFLIAVTITILAPMIPAFRPLVVNISLPTVTTTIHAPQILAKLE